MGLRAIELFAGAGGGCLASVLLGHAIVCYVERDPHCQRVLEQRIVDGLLPDAPIWDDVRTFPTHEFRGQVDVVCGGFPCQPFSVAGRGLAADDDRNCWPETFDIIRALRPAYAFLENVPGLLARSHGYFGHILGQLAEAGFDVEWGVLSAQAVGAPHRRERLWLLATDSQSDSQSRAAPDASSPRLERRRGASGDAAEKSIVVGDGSTRLASDVHCVGRSAVGIGGVLHGQRPPLGHDADGRFRAGPWQQGSAPEPTISRVDDGMAHWVERTRATGNGQVPLVAATAWHLLRGGS